MDELQSALFGTLTARRHDGSAPLLLQVREPAPNSTHEFDARMRGRAVTQPETRKAYIIGYVTSTVRYVRESMMRVLVHTARGVLCAPAPANA